MKAEAVEKMLHLSLDGGEAEDSLLQQRQQPLISSV